jgi:hypothetical protein
MTNIIPLLQALYCQPFFPEIPIPFLEGFLEFCGYLITITTRENIHFPTLLDGPNKKPNEAGS